MPALRERLGAKSKYGVDTITRMKDIHNVGVLQGWLASARVAGDLPESDSPEEPKEPACSQVGGLASQGLSCSFEVLRPKCQGRKTYVFFMSRGPFNMSTVADPK